MLRNLREIEQSALRGTAEFASSIPTQVVITIKDGRSLVLFSGQSFFVLLEPVLLVGVLRCRWREGKPIICLRANSRSASN